MWCGHKTLYLAIYHEEIYEINWFWASCCKFKKGKSYFDNFSLGVVQNGRGHLCHATLKVALSQEGNNEINWFFAWT